MPLQCVPEYFESRLDLVGGLAFASAVGLIFALRLFSLEEALRLEESGTPAEKRPRKKTLRRILGVLLAVLIVAIGFAFYRYAIGKPDEPRFRDSWEILPRDDHNVHAIEAYGTLAVAVISVVIAFLIYLSVKATNADVKATLLEVQSHERAIQIGAVQTIAIEILKIGRWMADHPQYRLELARPANQQSDIAHAAATVHADFLDAVMTQKHYYPEDSVELWRMWFKARREEWPQLDKYVQEAVAKGWYTNDFQGTDPSPQKTAPAAI